MPGQKRFMGRSDDSLVADKTKRLSSGPFAALADEYGDMHHNIGYWGGESGQSTACGLHSFLF